MRKASLVFCVGLLFLPVIAVAQQQSAPTQTAAPASADKAPASAEARIFTLNRMDICSTVKDRMPVDIETHFSANQERVFCYLEFGGAKKETSVIVVWTLGQIEVERVNLPVRRFPLFRTWATKTITGMKGDWRVDVLDENNTLIKSAAFTVQ